MSIAILIFTFVVMLFGLSLLFGAPFLPTQRKQIELAIDLLDIKKDQVIYDLGSGDGRILKKIAQKGAHAVGYEINPLLVIISMLRCWSYRQLVDIKWSNFWSTSLSEADGIYVFLLKKYMAKLNNKIVQDAIKPINVVSLAFTFPRETPIVQKGGLMLYKILPASKKY